MNQNFILLKLHKTVPVQVPVANEWQKKTIWDLKENYKEKANMHNITLHILANLISLNTWKQNMPVFRHSTITYYCKCGQYLSFLLFKSLCWFGVETNTNCHTQDKQGN